MDKLKKLRFKKGFLENKYPKKARKHSTENPIARYAHWLKLK